MKLLALVGDAFGGSGGIARYNRDLMTALTNSGAAIILLPREGRAERGTLPPGIDQRAPRGPASLTAAALVTAWRDGPFDAVFCGHVNLAPAAAIAAALLRVPLWLQLHGIEAWKPLSPAQHWAVERAALVTAVSRHTRHCFLGLSRVEPWQTGSCPTPWMIASHRGQSPNSCSNVTVYMAKLCCLPLADYQPPSTARGTTGS